MKAMIISLILFKDNLKLHFALDHIDHFLWPNLLNDGGLLFHFTLVTLQCVEIVIRQIIERVLDEFHDLNLEDKVLFESGSIVMNQTDSVIKGLWAIRVFYLESRPSKHLLKRTRS